MSDTAFVWAVGFLAQGFFSARILVQWVRSECACRVLSPSLFWALSLVGAWLFLFYGWLRHDFAIVFGQLISYYIYIWNLRAKGEWQRLPGVWRWVLQLSPVVAMGYVATDAPRVVARFLGNADVPLCVSVGLFFADPHLGIAAGLLAVQSCRCYSHCLLRTHQARYRAHCGPDIRHRGLQPQSLYRI